MDELFPPSELAGLLETLTVSRLAGSTSLPRRYSGIPSEILVRIHSLPYLLPLHSERALAYEVAERADLQLAVGLGDFDPPSRATLWHFRRRNQTAYRTVMRRALAVMFLEADRRDLRLPYVHSRDCIDVGSADHSEAFCDPVSGKSITVVWSEGSSRGERPSDQIDLNLGDSPREFTGRGKVRVLLHEELGFPMTIAVDFKSGAQLMEPSWLDAPYTTRDLSAVLGRAGKEPYTACTLIVMRSAARSSPEILLSQRKWGSGAGTYATPGGKKEEDETLRACAIRELREETGLIFQGGHPVSLTETRRAGYPPVRSVGILVTDWKGEPQNLDRAHTPWQWYPLSNLPTPLFFPTQTVLDHLKEDRMPALSWEDADQPIPPLPLWREML